MVDKKRQILNCREALSGSVVGSDVVKRQDDIDLRTLVKTQGSTGPLVDVSSTVVTVFAFCGEAARGVEWCRKKEMDLGNADHKNK